MPAEQRVCQREWHASPLMYPAVYPQLLFGMLVRQVRGGRGCAGPFLESNKSQEQQNTLPRGWCYFFGGVGETPFAEGLDAFCLGGPAFFGLRTSLPFDIFISLTLVDNAPRAVNSLGIQP